MLARSEHHVVVRIQIKSVPPHDRARARGDRTASAIIVCCVSGGVESPSAAVAIPKGWRDDPDGARGLAHLWEHAVSEAVLAEPDSAYVTALQCPALGVLAALPAGAVNVTRSRDRDRDRDGDGDLLESRTPSTGRMVAHLVAISSASTTEAHADGAAASGSEEESVARMSPAGLVRLNHCTAVLKGWPVGINGSGDARDALPVATAVGGLARLASTSAGSTSVGASLPAAAHLRREVVRNRRRAIQASYASHGAIDYAGFASSLSSSSRSAPRGNGTSTGSGIIGTAWSHVGCLRDLSEACSLSESDGAQVSGFGSPG